MDGVACKTHSQMEDLASVTPTPMQMKKVHAAHQGAGVETVGHTANVLDVLTSGHGD